LGPRGLRPAGGAPRHVGSQVPADCRRAQGSDRDGEEPDQSRPAALGGAHRPARQKEEVLLSMASAAGNFSHDEIRELLSAYADQELLADMRREVGEHLPGCSDCTQALHLQEEVSRILRKQRRPGASAELRAWAEQLGAPARMPMFDAVLRCASTPGSRIGTGATVSVLLHAALLASVLWISTRPQFRQNARDLAVKFLV